MSPRLIGGGFRALGKRALRAFPVAEAVRRIGALRGRSLVLVYHRVDDGRRPRAVVPTLPSDLFRRQVETLGEIGEIVDLQELLSDGKGGGRPRFAITFDDDYETHVERVLPILAQRDVPATFFLSGRSLHGLGSYWFELLERLIDTRGTTEVSRLIQAPRDEVSTLVTWCENDPARQRIIEAEGLDDPRHLGPSQIEILAGAGMAIGFHTLHHEVLTRLNDHDLDAALTQGRDELEAVIGRPLLHFAYPHGRADRRTADRIRDAGYEAAWTGRPHPMRSGDDPFLLGRWEPGRVDVDDFLVGTAVRLTRGVQGE
jgi:peptidoglycan/xylan/chitin deacetylase (PgdA/CDA1 family)